MSLLTQAEKEALTADFDQYAASTWLNPLIVWQEPQRTIITEDLNYNPYTSYNQNSTTVPVTPVATTISGRILWDKQQEWKFMTPYNGRGANEGQIKTKDQTSRACRLKVDASGYTLLKDCKIVQIDGVQLVPESQPRPHGLFWATYYTFYFVRQM